MDPFVGLVTEGTVLFNTLFSSFIVVHQNVLSNFSLKLSADF